MGKKSTQIWKMQIVLLGQSEKVNSQKAEHLQAWDKGIGRAMQAGNRPENVTSLSGIDQALGLNSSAA